MRLEHADGVGGQDGVERVGKPRSGDELPRAWAVVPLDRIAVSEPAAAQGAENLGTSGNGSSFAIERHQPGADRAASSAEAFQREIEGVGP